MAHEEQLCYYKSKEGPKQLLILSRKEFLYHRKLACLQLAGLHRGTGSFRRKSLTRKADMTAEITPSVRPLVIQFFLLSDRDMNYARQKPVRGTVGWRIEEMEGSRHSGPYLHA
jgi:hypothetical protein